MAGEQHDQAGHHELQASVIRAMPNGTSVGFEMFEYPQQDKLDDFTEGRMSEADFAVFFKRAWGFDYSLYKPVFDAARARGFKLVALNAPRAVIRQVAKVGLAGLTPAERAQLPARVDPITHPKYLAWVKAALQHGPMDPARLARLLEAQAAWNETMAAHVAPRMVVIAGMGHVLYGDGIGGCLRRDGETSIVTVLPGPSSELDQADFHVQP